MPPTSVESSGATPGNGRGVSVFASEVADAEVMAVDDRSGAAGPTPTPCPSPRTTMTNEPTSAANARTDNAIQSRRGRANDAGFNIGGGQNSVDAGASRAGVAVDAGAETSLPRSLNQPTK